MFSSQHIAKISVTESAYFCSLPYIIIKYVYIIGYLVVCIDYVIDLNGFMPYKGWRVKQARRQISLPTSYGGAQKITLHFYSVATLAWNYML